MNVKDRPANRTWLCSVVFMDIVAYTKHPLSQQIAIKNHFNDIISSISQKYFSESDLFLVDSGDGGALCYLGDPEDMLFCTRDLMRAFKSTSNGQTPIPMRIGINLGPVKIHISVSGHPNPIGDGINVAQRVMSFANEGQILISRSFYEVVGCLSEEYTSLFEHVGMRKDKHVRKHDLYRVRTAKEMADVITKKKKEATRKITLSDVTVEENSPLPILSETLSIIQHQFEVTLISHIGPIGKILIQKEFKANNSPTHIMRNLATHIQQESARSQFLSHAQNIINATQNNTNIEGKYADVDSQSQAKLQKKAQQTGFLHAIAQSFIKKPPTHSESVSESVTSKTPVIENSSGSNRTNTNSTQPWSTQDLALVAKHLASYMGPLATILVKKMSKQTSDLEELCEQLAKNIPQETERRRFLEQIQFMCNK
jgi:class 3 adenylate cyclase